MLFRSEFRFISRLLLAYFVALDLVLLVNVRLVARLTMTWLATGGHGSRVLVVGGGATAREVASLMVARPWAGLAVVGFAADDIGPSDQIDGIARLGKPGDAAAIVLAHAIDEVIVALPPDRHQETVQVALALLPLPVRVRIVPERFSMIAARARVENLWGVPLIGIRDPAIVGTDRVIKRAFDLAIGGIGLVILGDKDELVVGEGFGDIHGLLMTDDPRCAVGFYQSSCTSGIRNAANTCQYNATSCSSCPSVRDASGSRASCFSAPSTCASSGSRPASGSRKTPSAS